jgi:hypothetical protein
MQNILRSGILILVIVASATALAWAASAKYSPPPEVGMIWTVINYPRTGDRNGAVTVNVTWDRPRRQVIVPGPSYASPCATSTPAGIVFRLQNNNTSSSPLTINTTGTIVRGPYQGEAPPETLAACYKLVKG